MHTMKTLLRLTVLFAIATTLAAEPLRIGPNTNFASDFQTVPVVANVPGAGAVFQSYVALLNPTSSSFVVTATLFDSAGVKTEAAIPLAAGELKTYENFVDALFHKAGAGAVTFRSPDSSNRFVVTTEVRTSGTRFSTTVPALEFAGSNSRSFVAGITVSSATRTNVGCFNQSDSQNRITATVLDGTGTQVLGSTELNLPPNAWGQTGIATIVTEGYIRFDPAEAAVCYAVVVDNATADGRFISAAEYRP
jgi:hypothetical protein